MRKFAVFLPILAFASFVAGAVAVNAQSTQLGMLDQLERGGWVIALRNVQAPDQKICLSTGHELIQLRHSGLKCRSVVVDDTPNEVTVQYSCPGAGYGRTNIRRETNRLVQIDSQGIENGLPFAFAAEARWSGSCNR